MGAPEAGIFIRDGFDVPKLAQSWPTEVWFLFWSAATCRRLEATALLFRHCKGSTLPVGIFIFSLQQAARRAHCFL
jgi:hypothetical protein